MMRRIILRRKILMHQENSIRIADIGDYLKVFAFFAVVLQSVLALPLRLGLTISTKLSLASSTTLLSTRLQPLFLGFSILRSEPNHGTSFIPIVTIFMALGRTFLFQRFGGLGYIYLSCRRFSNITTITLDLAFFGNLSMVTPLRIYGTTR